MLREGCTKLVRGVSQGRISTTYPKTKCWQNKMKKSKPINVPIALGIRRTTSCSTNGSPRNTTSIVQKPHSGNLPIFDACYGSGGAAQLQVLFWFIFFSTEAPRLRIYVFIVLLWKKNKKLNQLDEKSHGLGTTTHGNLENPTPTGCIFFGSKCS